MVIKTLSELKKLASDDVIDNTPAPLEIFNNLTEAQVTEDNNSIHAPDIGEHDLCNLTTAVEQINNLKTEIAALKEFIFEQL